MGRLLSGGIHRSLSGQIAISKYVAAAMGEQADDVLLNGVTSIPETTCARRSTFLVLQRLEPEKQTLLALEAFRLSGLAAEGWTLDIAGSGSEEAKLKDWLKQTQASGIRLLGQVNDGADRLSCAGVFLATAPAEPLGLSVLESMATGCPVVAAAGGGHLETLGAGWPAFFPPGDARALSGVMRKLAADDWERHRLGERGRLRQRENFDVEDHVSALEAVYERVLSRPARRRGPLR